MNEIVDKILIFISCAVLYILIGDNLLFAIVPVTIVVLLSCLFLYYEDERIRLLGTIAYAFLCIIIPSYIIFLPLLTYDLFQTKYQLSLILVPLLLIMNRNYYNIVTISIVLLYFIISSLLKLKTDKIKTLQLEYNELRDSSTSISLLLEEKNRNLQRNQDYEVNLATLNERNRISKEIHDNVGHLLSRSLLQVGAMLTIAKDEVIQEGLTSLRDSLSVGMDQIRSSIHQMYDESIDLYTQVDRLVKDFTFCSISYEYDITNSPAIIVKHSLIAIIKEALANIMRHSNATRVSIVLREHPAMYQLVIRDNGTIDQRKKEKIDAELYDLKNMGGMGLNNISDRVKGLEGNFNVSLEKGFQIFITIPKKK